MKVFFKFVGKLIKRVKQLPSCFWKILRFVVIFKLNFGSLKKLLLTLAGIADVILFNGLVFDCNYCANYCLNNSISELL